MKTIPEGHVFEIGGVMCMELLMPEHWVPAYTVEGIILQVAATLVRGGGRVNFGASKDEYTLERAQLGLQKLEKMPDRSRKRFTEFQIFFNSIENVQQAGRRSLKTVRQ